MDSFLTNNSKINEKAIRKYCKNPKTANNNSSSSLKKIQSLPISKKSKDTLSNLVINHAIDVTKLVKINDKSVTLHGIAKNKKTGSAEDAIIKIYSENRKTNDKLYAYSRNIHNEEKKFVIEPYPNTILTDKDFLKEHIVYYKDDNIVIMKFFKHCKTIEQMIKSFPNMKENFLGELLRLYADICKRDIYFWNSSACTIKNIIWHDGKWIYLSTNYDNNNGYCSGNGEKNLLDIIYMFKSYGMTNAELTKIIKEQVDSNYYFPPLFRTVGFFEKYFPLKEK